MSTLTTATNAPAESLALPGYRYSRWALNEYGEAEQRVAALHLKAANDAASLILDANGRPDIVAKTTYMRMAMDDVRNKTLNYGSPAFDEWATSISSLPFIFWLSVRRNNKNITSEAEAALLLSTVEEKQGEILKEVLQYSLGYNFFKGNEKTDNLKNQVGIDTSWSLLFKMLSKLGYTLDQICDLTIPQIVFVLSDFEEDDQTIKVEIIKRLQDRQTKIFEAVMVQFKLSKVQLAALEINDLKSYIAAVEPKAASAIVDDKLREAIKNFCTG